LNRRKWVIITTTTVAVVVAIMAILYIPATYSASAVLRVIPYSSQDASYTQLIYADRIMNTYVKIADSGPILNQLKQKLDLNPDLLLTIKTEIIPETELLQITVQDQNAVLARNVANTLSELLVEENPMRNIKIYIVDPAVMTKPPSPFQGIMKIGLALILGLIGGIASAFLLENLDTRVYTVERIQTIAELPVIARIPAHKKIRNDAILCDLPPFRDSISRLHHHIFLVLTGQAAKTLLITSAGPGEGKSSIAANLAISIAQSGRRIVLVDCDLYHPTLHKLFDLSNISGLSNFLLKNKSLMEVLQDCRFSGIRVISSGPVHPSSAELLGSEQMNNLLQQLADQFDLVIIDTPAYLGVVDTAVLAPIVDSILLVTYLGRVRASDLFATCQQLKKLNQRLIGVVVNGEKAASFTRYQKYYKHVKLEDKTNDIPEGDIPTSQDSYALKEGVSDSEDGSLQVANKTCLIQIHKVDQLTKEKLSEIRGIGPTIENELYMLGILTFEELADQNPDDLAKKLNGKCKITANRILKEGWLVQAKGRCQSDHKVQL
jgi:polysaccharide biosynthesis transport protein